MYVSNYMVKEALTKERTLPIVREMVNKALRRQASAADKDTRERQVNFITQVILNGLHAKMETSAPMAGSMLLSHKSTETTVALAWLHAHRAMSYCRSRWPGLYYRDMIDESVDLDELRESDTDIDPASASTRDTDDVPFPEMAAHVRRKNRKAQEHEGSLPSTALHASSAATTASARRPGVPLPRNAAEAAADADDDVAGVDNPNVAAAMAQRQGQTAPQILWCAGISDTKSNPWRRTISSPTTARPPLRTAMAPHEK